MGFARILILLGLMGFTIHWWNGRDPGALASEARPTDEASQAGFVPAAMPDGTPPNTVVILAPLNCPSDGAQRAENLAEQLKILRIPVLRSSQYSARTIDTNSDQVANLNRAVGVLNGPIPAVFVNGMAKANPSVDEVVAEYQRTK